MRWRLRPCTPSPTTITRTVLSPSLESRAALERLQLGANLRRRDRHVPLALAGHGCGQRAQHGCDHLVAARDHGERGVREQRIARADGVDDLAREGLEGEEGAHVLELVA